MVRILLTAILVTTVLGCERPEPRYRLKDPSGLDTTSHFDDMADQPKWIRVKKEEIDKKKAIEERRVMREQSRGIYRKQSQWDF